METYKKNGLDLISNLALSVKKYPAVVKYTPAKIKHSRIEPPSLPRCAPEKVGVPSSVLIEILDELEVEEKANLHSMIIVKDGFVISECARKGYSARRMHLSHSMSKTVTGMIIGMLIDDERLSLSDTLAKLFPEYDIHPETAKITVNGLLTMSSGIPFSEVGAVTDTEWTLTFLSSAPAFIEGEKFAYNSMNSYILMVIAHRLINEHYGMTVEDFIKERLFSPLGITDFLWEKGPEEIEKGGWGLHLSAESWAKLGMMMLEGGVYNGTRILSEAFVAAATSTQSITPSEMGDFNYGYQLWVSRSAHDFLFNGMLGQKVLIIPKNNIVVAINAGNNELFHESPALAILRKHLSCDLRYAKGRKGSHLLLHKKTESFYSSRIKVTPKQKKRGIAEFFGLKSKTPFDPSFSLLLDTRFVFAENSQGILPLFVRAMQNNYQGGIDSFEFSREGESLLLNVTEGGVNYIYRIGIYDYEFTELDYCGEKYTVGVLAAPDFDMPNGWAYHMEFIFPELPNSRMINLFLCPNGFMKVEMTETPDSNIAESFIDSIPAMSPKINFAMNMLESNLGRNFIEKRVSELFSSTLSAISEKGTSFEALIANENAKVKEKMASMGMVRMLISTLTGSGEPENQKPASLGGLLISSFLGKIFSKNQPEDKTDQTKDK